MRRKNYIFAKTDDTGVKYVVSWDSREYTVTWSRNVLDAKISTHTSIENADDYAARFGAYALPRSAAPKGGSMKHSYLITGLLAFSCSMVQFHPPSSDSVKLKSFSDMDIYEKAEFITGTDADLIRGIAYAETRNLKHPDKARVGKGGYDRGRFGLRETKAIRDWRLWKYGSYDPHDPQSAAIVVGYIIRDNVKYYERENRDMVNKLHGIAMMENHKPLHKAISAYNQGINGNKKYGINWRYIDTVKEGMLECR